MNRLTVMAALLSLVAPALADLKKPDIIDCNAKKAARNAAMEATVGVHGSCDADKLAKDAKKDAGKKVEGAREDLGDKLDLDKDRDKKGKDQDE